MEINQAIEDWLELCPCDNFTVKDLQTFGGKFNRSKTITLLYNEFKIEEEEEEEDGDDYEPSDQEMMAAFGTKWHDGL